MMRAALIATALVGSQGFNVTSNVDCAEIGVSFTQANLTKANAAMVDSAKVCQQTCKDMLYCESFTWHPQSDVPGECFLFGNQATKIADATAISGPAECGNSTSNTTGPVVVTDASVAAGAVSDSSGGSSFPWLLILALILIVCLVGACVGYSFMTSKKEKKSSKRSAKVTAAEEAPQVQYQEGGVQMSQMQPMPMYYQTASYASPGVQYQQVTAPPQTYYYTSEGPMLYQDGVQLQPVDYQQPVEYMQGQVQYLVEPQV